MSIFYKTGQHAARIKLGLDRVPQLDSESNSILESPGVDPELKNEMLEEVRRQQAEHSLEPRSSYMLSRGTIGGLTGAGAGGLLGLGMSKAPGPLKRLGTGAAIGGLIGAPVGALTGSAQYSGDRSEKEHAEQVLQDPKKFKRDVAGFAVQRDEREEQRRMLESLQQEMRHQELLRALEKSQQGAPYAGSTQYDYAYY